MSDMSGIGGLAGLHGLSGAALDSLAVAAASDASDKEGMTAALRQGKDGPGKDSRDHTEKDEGQQLLASQQQAQLQQLQQQQQQALLQQQLLQHQQQMQGGGGQLLQLQQLQQLQQMQDSGLGNLQQAQQAHSNLLQQLQRQLEQQGQVGESPQNLQQLQQLQQQAQHLLQTKQLQQQLSVAQGGGGAGQGGLLQAQIQQALGQAHSETGDAASASQLQLQLQQLRQLQEEQLQQAQAQQAQLQQQELMHQHAQLQNLPRLAASAAGVGGGGAGEVGAEVNLQFELAKLNELNIQHQQAVQQLQSQQSAQLAQAVQILGVTGEQLRQIQLHHHHQQQQLLQRQQQQMQLAQAQLQQAQSAQSVQGGASQQLQQTLQQQLLQQLQSQMSIPLPSASGADSLMLAQQLNQIVPDESLNLAKGAGEGGDKTRGAGSNDTDSSGPVLADELETVLAHMSAVLEEAKEFLKQQKKPVAGSHGSEERNEQDEQDMIWISADDFSGAGKKLPPPTATSAADKKMLAEFGTFKSAFGSRGLPLSLPSYEFLPASSDKHPIPLAVTDKDLKFMVLLLMQETLYTAMLQEWEHQLGGTSSLKLLQETLSILSLAQDLSQADLKNILRVKEQGLGEAWKRIWSTLNESIGCTSKNLLSFQHAALRLAVERRYVLSSDQREYESIRRAQHTFKKAGQQLSHELGGDWATLRSFLSRTLASLEAGFAREHQSKQELPTGVIKSCIIIARFLGDSGQFREADVLFDRARVLAIKGGNKHFCAEVSLYCAELLNKWSASDPAYSVDTMARSAKYASQAAMLYDSIEPCGDAATQATHLQKFSQALYWKGLNYSTLCRLGGTEGCSAETACGTAREALDKCLALRKEIKASSDKIAEVQFARGVLTFCMAEALSSGHIYRGLHGNGTRSQAARGLYQKAMELFHEVYEDWRSRLGDAALETVKAVTMLSTVANKLDGPTAALKWSKMEVQIREEVQGTLHPRTQQAKRNHANLLEALAAQNARRRAVGSSSDDASAASEKNSKDDQVQVKGESDDGDAERFKTLLSKLDELDAEAAEAMKAKRKSRENGEGDANKKRQKVDPDSKYGPSEDTAKEGEGKGGERKDWDAADADDAEESGGLEIDEDDEDNEDKTTLEQKGEDGKCDEPVEKQDDTQSLADKAVEKTAEEGKTDRMDREEDVKEDCDESESAAQDARAEGLKGPDKGQDN